MSDIASAGLSVRAYARVRGVSHVAVMKAIKTRRISQNEDGTIDPKRANEEWDRNTFAGATLRQVAKQSAASPQVAPVSVGAAPTRRDPIAAYLDARAVGETFRAKITQLEYEERAGKLIQATKAGEYASSFSNIARDQVSAWAERLTPVLMPFFAPGTDDAVIHRLLMREGDATLRKIAKAITDAGY